MPIDRAVLDDHAQRRGPHLYHVTVQEALASIRANGLVPGSQRDHRVRGGFFATRADHVYLCDLLTIAVVEVPGERALLAVDLRQLEPERIDPDEDAVQQSFMSPEGPWLPLENHPPIREMNGDAERPGQEQALARWADETEGFDAPEVAAKSLAGGRISHRGAIPAEALEEIHVPSEAAGHYVAGAASVLGPGVLLPAAPLLGDAETEIERASALAAHVIDVCAPSVSMERRARTRFDRPEAALPVQDSLMKEARELRYADELEASLLPSAAAELAEAVAEFQPEVGWSANRDQCAIVAERAVDCLRIVLEKHGRERAEELARSAVLVTVGSEPL
jgi:hypothetical protein